MHPADQDNSIGKRGAGGAPQARNINIGKRADRPAGVPSARRARLQGVNSFS
jgi:hypothetical protein